MNFNVLKWSLFSLMVGCALTSTGQKKETLQALKYTVYLNEDPSKVKKLYLGLKNGEVGIKGTSKKHITITAIRGWKKGKRFNYEYQKVLTIDKIDLRLDQDENKVQLLQRKDEHMVYWIEIPKSMSVKVDDVNESPNKVTITDIDADVHVNTMASLIDIQSINGRVSANSHAGNIKVAHINGNVDTRTIISLIKVNNINGPILANSQAGDILIVYDNEVTQSSVTSAGRKVTLKMKKTAKANLKLKVMTGSVNSDFKLGISQSELKGKGNMRNLEGKINGGGAKIYVMAHTVDIKRVK